MPLTVTRLGLAPDFVDYRRAWELQRALHARVTRDPSAGRLLLLEHTPTYTAGRRTTPADRPADGTPVIDVDRGGLLTWHGPGQLVAYPIVALRDPMAIKDYVYRLEAAIIDTVAAFGVGATRVEGRAGVWVLTPGEPDRKIAAIGIHVDQGVTMHGLALNVDNSLAPYEVIVPCGIRDAGVSTLAAESGRPLTPNDVVGRLESELLRHLGPAVTAQRRSGTAPASIQSPPAEGALSR